MIANLKTIAVKKDIDGSVFNSFIFNKSTVEIVLNELMTRGIQTASGDEIGKTIILLKIMTMRNISEVFLTTAILKRERLCSGD